MTVDDEGATYERVVGSSPVPVEACTLPTAEQPMRLREFDDLFASSLRGLHRETPGWLRLRLRDGEGVEDRARDLTAREAECCAFFDFDVHRDTAEVVVDVRVPPGREAVLDGLIVQAESARDAHGVRGVG